MFCKNLFFLAGVLAAISCGKASVTQPSGATTRIVGTARTTSVGSTASPVSLVHPSKPAAGVVVTLVGTGRSASTDSLGNFTITGAPLGGNTLLFEGQGSRGNVTLDLHEGKVLNLAVEIDGGNVNLVCEVEEPDGNNNDGQHTPSGGSGANACDKGDQNNAENSDGENDEGEVSGARALATTAVSHFNGRDR